MDLDKMDLGKFLTIIKSSRNEIIVIILIVAIIIMGFSALKRPVYDAEALLEYQSNSPADSFIGKMNIPGITSQPQRQVSTFAKLLKSKTLAANVINKMNLKIEPEALISKVNVKVDNNTDLIEVVVSDNDPRLAQSIANNLSTEFIEMVKRKITSDVTKAKDQVSFKMRDIQEDLRFLDGQSASAQPGSDSSANAKTKAAIATSIYTDLAKNYQQLKIVEDLSGGGLKLASPAILPQSPSSPNLRVNGFLALLLGSMLGMAWAFLREYLNNTIKSSEDVEKHFNLPAIGQIPAVEMKTEDEGAEPEAVGNVKPNSLAGEAFRSLRTNINFLNFEDQIKTILITSPVSGDGKTTIAANLASTMAFANNKVLLIDCDLRHPGMQKTFNIENFIGLSSLLIDSNNIGEVIKDAEMSGLSLISSGPIPPNPSELLGSNKMAALLEILKKEFDYIILDSPPVCLVTDAAVLASKVDGVLLVSAYDESSIDSIGESLKRLDNVKSRVLGVVINKMNMETGKYGYPYYGKYYGQYFNNDQDEDKDLLAG